LIFSATSCMLFFEWSKNRIFMGWFKKMDGKSRACCSLLL